MDDQPGQSGPGTVRTMRRGKLHNKKATDYDNYITVAEPGDQPDQGGPAVLQVEFGKAGGGLFPLLRQIQGLCRVQQGRLS
jgi:hypothetical protein